KFDFGNEADQAQEKVDFSAQQPLGKCPQCGHSVYEHKLLYVCEKSVGAGASCSFRTGKIILNRAIEAEQVVKLLQTGRTDLLAGFVSRKGRPFSAYLVVGPAGKIGFEFEQKKTKSKPADTVPETGKAAS
ncbi:MAG: topoisomerase C-terminal repeat-containing protein, partial [Nitrosomonas sp.]